MSNRTPAEYCSRVNRGAASEMIAAAHLMSLGYHVFRALAVTCPVDMVAMRDDGAPLRVEVKSGCFTPPSTHTFVRPKRDNWDLLVVVSLTGECFVYSADDFDSASALLHYRAAQIAAIAEAGAMTTTRALSDRRTAELPTAGVSSAATLRQAVTSQTKRGPA